MFQYDVPFNHKLVCFLSDLKLSKMKHRTSKLR